MEQEKSPFEEIFKRERKKEEKEKEDEGILGTLEKGETNIFKESGDKVEEKAPPGEEERYRNLILELLEHHYFDESVSIIKEMKEKFGN